MKQSLFENWIHQFERKHVRCPKQKGAQIACYCASPPVKSHPLALSHLGWVRFNSGDILVLCILPQVARLQKCQPPAFYCHRPPNVCAAWLSTELTGITQCDVFESHESFSTVVLFKELVLCFVSEADTITSHPFMGVAIQLQDRVSLLGQRTSLSCPGRRRRRVFFLWSCCVNVFWQLVSVHSVPAVKVLHTCRQFPWRDAADENSWYGEMRRADSDEITRSVSEDHSVGSVMGDGGDHRCVNKQATRRHSALKFRPRVHKVAAECWACWVDWLESMRVGFLKRLGVTGISCQFFQGVI